jgi:hypothetical protein
VAPREAPVGKDAGQEMFRLMNLGFARTVPTALPFAAKAWASVLPGMFLSLLGLAAPTVVLLAVAMTGGQDADFSTAKLNLSYARPTMLVVMAIQLVYFLMVGFIGTRENIRASANAADQPAPLSWNLQGGAKALAPLGAMVGVYGVLIVMMALICGLVPPGWQHSLGWLHPVEWPLAFWIGLGLVLVLWPMSLIGLASRHWLAGVNPVAAARSVGRTFGAYLLLLFLILLVMLFLWALMAWAGRLVLYALVAGESGGLSALLERLSLALPAWAFAIGLGLFASYLIARWLGLFALNHRQRLAFTF